MRGVNGSRIPPAGNGVQVAVEGQRTGARAPAAQGGEQARAFGRALARGARLQVRVDGVERDQLARELDDVVHGRVYGITEMSWQHDLVDGLVDAGVEVAAWVPDKRLAPIGERLVA